MSKVHQAALAISKRAICRWCLTGTPIHNSIDDYGALLSFLRVPKLSEKRAFDHWVTKPLRHRQPNDINRLKQMVRATCIRRTICTSMEMQAPIERIAWVDLGEVDQELYNFFKSRAAELASGVNSYRAKSAASRSRAIYDDNILRLINCLRLICDYGEKVLPTKAIEAWRSKSHCASYWKTTEQHSQQCSDCKEPVARFDDDSILSCGHGICDMCQQRIQEGENLDDVNDCLMCQAEDEAEDTVQGSSGSYQSAKVATLVRNILTEQSNSPGSQEPRKR